MKIRLSELVEKFDSKKIIIVGDPMLDEYIYGTVTRISPEAPVNIVKKEFVYHFPGGAANAANNISSLGGTSILMGVIGDDNNKERVLKVMKDLNIVTDYIIVDKNRPTTLKTRIVANNQQVVRVDTESTNDIKEELENIMINNLKKIVHEADVVILSDYAKGSLTERICREAIRICKVLGKTIIVDPKVDFSKYRSATIITPNEKEFREFSGITGEYDDSDVIKVIEENNIDAMLITKGKKGMALYKKDGKIDIPATNHGYEVVDISGAGDTVVSVFALALSNGASLEQAAELANIAAGIVVRKKGTATTNMGELKKELIRLKR